MAVKAGSKLKIRAGCHSDFIGRSQVVTVKDDPFIVGNIVCITLVEHEGIFCLDQFSEPGQTGPAMPANTESLGAGVSPEAVTNAIETLENLGQEIEKEAARIKDVLAHAAAIAERKNRNRQTMKPRGKRRRR